MFEIDGGKLLIIGIVALVVIGPKELPAVLRQVGQAIARLRRMAAEFQGQFMQAMREAELDDVQKDIVGKVDVDGLNPFASVRKEIASVKSDLQAALDPRIGNGVAATPVDPAPPQPSAAVEATATIEAAPATSEAPPASADAANSQGANPPIHPAGQGGTA